jgi:hypothetical protein
VAVLVAKAELPDALSELPLGHPDRKARQAVGDFEKCDLARQVHTPSPSFTARSKMSKPLSVIPQRLHPAAIKQKPGLVLLTAFGSTYV